MLVANIFNNFIYCLKNHSYVMSIPVQLQTYNKMLNLFNIRRINAKLYSWIGISGVIEVFVECSFCFVYIQPKTRLRKIVMHKFAVYSYAENLVVDLVCFRMVIIQFIYHSILHFFQHIWAWQINMQVEFLRKIFLIPYISM